MLQRVMAAATAVFLALGGAAQAGATLDGVKQRGVLNCGVNVGIAGFSLPDSQGTWRGMDADLCRAVAAAVLGDPGKVRFVPLTAVQRFTALQSGEIDVLIRQTTLTMTRDTSLGMRMVGVNLYDGHGFMVAEGFLEAGQHLGRRLEQRRGAGGLDLADILAQVLDGLTKALRLLAGVVAGVAVGVAHRGAPCSGGPPAGRMAPGRGWRSNPRSRHRVPPS